MDMTFAQAADGWHYSDRPAPDADGLRRLIAECAAEPSPADWGMTANDYMCWLRGYPDGTPA